MGHLSIVSGRNISAIVQLISILVVLVPPSETVPFTYPFCILYAPDGFEILLYDEPE